MILHQHTITYLQAIGQKYINFLQMYGMHDEHVCEPIMAELFAQHCKKVLNGEIKCLHIVDIKQHLYKIKSMYGPWIIQWQHENILGDQEKGLCVVRYTKVIEPLGAFNYSTILVCDELGFIIEIHETYALKAI